MKIVVEDMAPVAEVVADKNYTADAESGEETELWSNCSLDSCLNNHLYQ